jgi:hypothetical protein
VSIWSLYATRILDGQTSVELRRKFRFPAVRQVVRLTGIAGEWSTSENHCQFRAANGAVLNYWKSTGTITFQGPEFAAAELKAMVLQRAFVVKQ